MRRVIAQPDGDTVRVTLQPPQSNSVPLIIVLKSQEAALLLDALRKVLRA